MKSIGVVAGLLALAVPACGSSSGVRTTDGGADRTADMTGSAGHGGGAGTGGPTQSGGGAGGPGGVGGAGAGGRGSALGTGGVGGAGAGGQGGTAGPRDGGSDAPVDAAGCQSQNPDPCACNRPDANTLSSKECADEKACLAAGRTWEPYVVFLSDGGSYGPRCQSPDGAAFDAF